MFFSTVPLFTIVDKTFLPYDDEGQFAITVRAPEGASVATTQTIARVDRHARAQARRASTNTVVTIGDDPQQTLNLATVYVKLGDAGERERPVRDHGPVRKEILPQYQRLNLRTQVAPVNEFGGGTDAEVMFWIGGPDLEQLDKYAQRADRSHQAIRSSARPTSTRTSSSASRSSAVRIDRDKATDLGVRVQDLAATLNVLVGGQQATSYYEGGEEYEVHVRAEESVAQQRRRASRRSKCRPAAART